MDKEKIISLENLNQYSDETSDKIKSYLDTKLNGGAELSGSTEYTVTDSVEYPIVGLKVFGKSTQDGTPTPENPVEIVSVGDGGSVKVQTCGKNLLDLRKCVNKTLTKNGVTITVNDDSGEIFVNGTATKATTINFSSKSQNGEIPYSKLTMSGCPDISVNSEIFRLQFWYSSPTAGTKQFWSSSAYPEITLTLPNDYTEYIFSVFIQTGYTADNIVVKPMLRPAEILDDTFEPYKGNTATITSALPLCGIPVESGGNYTDSNGQQWACDELIYNADGTGKIIKRTAKIDSYNGETVSGVYCSSTGGLDTGATVIYQIDTSQEIELTASEMVQLRQLQTYNGTTNISNDKGAVIEVGYCTNKALSSCVAPITTGLQKQIDDLKAAVLSLGGNV